MNPIKKIRKNKNISVNKFARLLDSNPLTLNKVEKGDCLSSTYLTIIRKISLNFDDIDDGKLIKEYNDWLQKNNIQIKG